MKVAISYYSIVHSPIGDWKYPFMTYPDQGDLPRPAPATSSRWANPPPGPSDWAPLIQSSKTSLNSIKISKQKASPHTACKNMSMTFTIHPLPHPLTRALKNPECID